jgi:hypothetical protein
MEATMPTSAPTEIRTIRVRIWDDPLVDDTATPCIAATSRPFLLPVLGPSATWALRRLAAMANARV